MPTKKEIIKAQRQQSRDTLSDDYIIDLLLNGYNKLIMRKDSYLKASDIRKFPELIECKRIQLKIARLIKFRKQCGKKIVNT